MAEFISQSVKYVGGYGGDDSIESAAKTSTMAQKSKNPVGFVKSLLKRGHMTPMEFGYADFLIECDRGIQQELTRHRLFSFLIESTRWIDYRKKTLRFVTEPTEGWDVPREAVELLREWCALSESVYETLLDMGAGKDYSRKALPLATASKMRMAGNSRVWFEMIVKRLGPTVHPEAKAIAKQVAVELMGRFVGLFDGVLGGEE